jgi:hypothetical protein
MMPGTDAGVARAQAIGKALGQAIQLTEAVEKR